MPEKAWIGDMRLSENGANVQGKSDKMKRLGMCKFFNFMRDGWGVFAIVGGRPSVPSLAKRKTYPWPLVAARGRLNIIITRWALLRRGGEFAY